MIDEKGIAAYLFELIQDGYEIVITDGAFKDDGMKYLRIRMRKGPLYLSHCIAPLDFNTNLDADKYMLLSLQEMAKQLRDGDAAAFVKGGIKL